VNLGAATFHIGSGSIYFDASSAICSMHSALQDVSEEILKVTEQTRAITRWNPKVLPTFG